MLRVFNTQAITKNQRFARGLLMGLAAAIGCAILYAVIVPLIHIEFSIFFVGMGYVIGEAISRFGRGVQTRFSVLGAVCTFLSILLADVMTHFGFMAAFAPFAYVMQIQLYFASFTSLNAILSILFRVLGIYVGYATSRVI